MKKLEEGWVVIDEWVSEERIISEYSNENRRAVILSLKNGGFEVLMFDNYDLKLSRVVDKNVQYAQDLAENFVMRWGEFK